MRVAAQKLRPFAPDGAVTNTLGFVTWSNNTYTTPGLPIDLAYGSTGLSAPSAGPLVWDPNQNRVSFGRSILVYD